jgi:hypothetical protein
MIEVCLAGVGSVCLAGNNDTCTPFAAKSAAGQGSSDCRKAILFLTDGEPTNENDHEEMIRQRNTKHGAHIFTYALGSGATAQDGIACDNNGMYTSIVDGGNLRGKMAGYYQLFALSSVRTTFWTAPYLDASGNQLLEMCLTLFYANRVSSQIIIIIKKDWE